MGADARYAAGTVEKKVDECLGAVNLVVAEQIALGQRCTGLGEWCDANARALAGAEAQRAADAATLEHAISDMVIPLYLFHTMGLKNRLRWLLFGVLPPWQMAHEAEPMTHEAAA